MNVIYSQINALLMPLVSIMRVPTIVPVMKDFMEMDLSATIQTNATLASMSVLLRRLAQMYQDHTRVNVMQA